MQKQHFDLTQTAFWNILQNIIKVVMIVGSVVSTACMCYSVILRYIFHKNFYGSDEVIMLFAFWLYFMGAVYGSYEDSHIKADLLNVYIKNLRIKDALALVAQALTIFVNTIVLTWAYKYFLLEINKGGLSTALKIPLVIPKSAVFFGFLLMEFYHVYYFIHNILLYVRKGHFTEPQLGDYVTDAMKKKYPGIDVPSKKEAAALVAKELGKEGEG